MEWFACNFEMFQNLVLFENFEEKSQDGETVLCRLVRLIACSYFSNHIISALNI